jgi:hypothetical protein
MRRVIVYKNITREVLCEGYLIQFINDIECVYALIELKDGSIMEEEIRNVKYKYPTEGE